MTISDFATAEITVTGYAQRLLEAALAPIDAATLDAYPSHACASGALRAATATYAAAKCGRPLAPPVSAGLGALRRPHCRRSTPSRCTRRSARATRTRSA